MCQYANGLRKATVRELAYWYFVLLTHYSIGMLAFDTSLLQNKDPMIL